MKSFKLYLVEKVMETLTVCYLDINVEEEFYCLEFTCKDYYEREIVGEFMLKLSGTFRYGENYLKLFTILIDNL